MQVSRTELFVDECQSIAHSHQARLNFTFLFPEYFMYSVSQQDTSWRYSGTFVCDGRTL